MRLRDCIENVLDDCQFGLRPGRSTADALFTVKMTLHNAGSGALTSMLYLFISKRHLTETTEIFYGEHCRKTTIMRQPDWP